VPDGGGYVEVTINGVHYTSLNGGVAIDADTLTWAVQVTNALPLKDYNVEVVIKTSVGAVIISDDPTIPPELHIVGGPETPDSPPATADSNAKAVAMTIGEDGQWRLFANGAVMDAIGTDSVTIGNFSANALTANAGPVSAATFIDFDRDGLMDIVGNDTTYWNPYYSQYSDGQQVYKYMGANAGKVAGTAGENGKPVSNDNYYAFQMGSNSQWMHPDRVDNNYSHDANVSTAFAGVAAYDRDGDGYVDIAYGTVFGGNNTSESYLDGGADTQLILNDGGVFTKDGDAIALNSDSPAISGASRPSQSQAGPEKLISAVDINNDGRIDLAWGANGGDNESSGAITGNSAPGQAVSTNDGRLVIATGQSGGSLKVTQTVDNAAFNDDGAVANTPSMTWADFNGDGWMDLFMSSAGTTGELDTGNSVIYLNNGAGKLSSSPYTLTGGATEGSGSVAVDWNADGKMDVIETPLWIPGGDPVGSQAVQLFLNTSSGGTMQFVKQANLATLPDNGAGSGIAGLLSLDLDWDGDKDLMLFTGNAGATYVENKAVIADGTALHFRIVDKEGINSFFSNTVQLYDSQGNLVATQIINPQAGNQTNDSSAIVDFYGLNPNETYSVVLLKSVNGVSDDVGGLANLGGNAIENVNIAWTGLKAGAANDAYVLTAEAGNASNNATIGNGIVGTGYNDTFFATLGTDKYEGGGGTTIVSGEKVWSDTGGMDIVDYKLAGNTPLTIDLSNPNAQNTGFGTGATTFSNIEGIAGGGGNDTFTDNARDNVFEGRGGNDTFNLTHGGHDTLLYKLLVAADATGGNGADQVNGFKVGLFEVAPNADQIDISELLIGYSPGTSNINDYLSVSSNGTDTVISIDRDGAGGNYAMTELITLNSVSVDLATLLMNHQLTVV
jgi:hypothetical protein